MVDEILRQKRRLRRDHERSNLLRLRLVAVSNAPSLPTQVAPKKEGVIPFDREAFASLHGTERLGLAFVLRPLDAMLTGKRFLIKPEPRLLLPPLARKRSGAYDVNRPLVSCMESKERLDWTTADSEQVTR